MGNVLIAQKLNYEARKEYTLNISVTDTVHTVYVPLYISVLDLNNHRPEFSKDFYKFEMSEAVPLYTEVTTNSKFLPLLESMIVFNGFYGSTCLNVTNK